MTDKEKIEALQRLIGSMNELVSEQRMTHTAFYDQEKVITEAARAIIQIVNAPAVSASTELDPSAF